MSVASLQLDAVPARSHSHSRETRVLAAFVAASATLHALIAIWMPDLRAMQVVVADPLQVTLEKREPPPIVAARPAPAAPALDRERVRPRKAAPQRPVPPEKEAPPSELRREAPVIALPQTPATPEPTFAVPAQESKPAAAPSAPVGPREPARGVPVPEPPAPARVTPPVSDAAYLHNPQPRYPLSARRRGEQGTVVVRVLVTREGLPGSVTVQSSSGSASLDQAALEAVKNWRFMPARQGTQPVEAWHLVPIVFRLEGTS
ncbi:MAG: TonB family protein [Burkholderiales bacterium]